MAQLKYVSVETCGLYDRKGKILLSLYGPKGGTVANAPITRTAATALIAALQNAIENSEGE